MKIPNKNGQGHNLQTRNHRWKWMAGATAATAAGVTASQGTLVTINLTNNYISGSQGNHLNADLTGDGHPDLTISRASAFRSIYTPRPLPSGSGYTFARARVQAYLNGVRAAAHTYGDFGIHSEILGSQYNTSGGPSTLMGTIPIFFKDLRINGGAPTRGLLEVSVFAHFNTDAGIQLDSLTYNTPGPGSRLASIPDEGSGLALLAMGAGGILAFGRWRATQEHS